MSQWCEKFEPRFVITVSDQITAADLLTCRQKVGLLGRGEGWQTSSCRQQQLIWTMWYLILETCYRVDCPAGLKVYWLAWLQSRDCITFYTFAVDNVSSWSSKHWLLDAPKFRDSWSPGFVNIPSENELIHDETFTTWRSYVDLHSTHKHYTGVLYTIQASSSHIVRIAFMPFQPL